MGLTCNVLNGASLYDSVPLKLACMEFECICIPMLVEGGRDVYANIFTLFKIVHIR